MKRKNRLRILIGCLSLLLLTGIIFALLHFSALSASTIRTSNSGSTGRYPSGNSASTPTPTTATHTFVLQAKPTVIPAPTPQPTTPHATPSPGGSNLNPWSLVFSDDFTGPQLNPQWITYNGPHAGGQSYYDSHEVQVQNGLLHIQMEQKTTGGLLYTTGGLGAMRIVQVYGKYEMRVRLPYGKGVGPYAILWPTNGDASRQVDLFESPPADKSTLYCTNHGGPGGTSTQIQVHGNFAADFHTLTYEWMPGKLIFLVDGISQGVLTTNIPTQPMWLGIAVSSGDAFTGLPDSTTHLPVSLDVDWVHIYKYTG